MEEWFHILDLPKFAYNSDWNNYPSRAEIGLDRFLDILSHFNISCTFFILGWVAEKYPNLVRKIDSFGYEIASHGYGHELIYRLGPDLFRQDIRKAKRILEDLTGNEIQGYRGPGFSITTENTWAFDVIAEEGFRYDATLYPGKHAHGGMPGMQGKPFLLLTSEGNRIEEYPVTLMNIAGYRLAFAGGGYFRLFPFVFISQCIKWLNRRGTPTMSYLHPRDLDPGVPSLPMSWKRRFKCYVNLSRSCDKLEKMLSAHAFGSIRDWRDGRDGPLPVFSLKDWIFDKA